MLDLFRVSRPFSWINTALPFFAMAWTVHRGLSPSIILGTIYFLAPYNLLLYGVNDRYDYESDRLNPRKGGAIEGGMVGPGQIHRLWAAIALTNVPLYLLLAWLGGPTPAVALAITVAVAIVYSMPPFRTKVIPGLDSATSSLHFVLPAVCGGIAGGASLTGLPWRLLLAFFLWGVASHALGAIQDVRYDREAGIGSIAVGLGARNTAVFSLVGYSVAVLLVASYGGSALAAAAALLPYVLLAASCLTADVERQARRAWHGFLGMNLLAGFIITQVLLRIWGAGNITALQLLAWGTAGGIFVISAHAYVNERAMRRRAPTPVRWPSLSVIIPVRNEGRTIGDCLVGLRLQRYEGEWETIVVDDESTDETAVVAGALLRTRDRLLHPGSRPASWTGKCWAANHGAQVARGEVLVFLDADTVLEPLALQAMAREIQATGGLFSILTRYRMVSRVEQAFMPAFTQMVMCFLPIAWLNASRHPHPFLVYGYGPCMVVSRRDYQASGGHAAIQASERDDLDLPRTISAAGYRVRFLRGADLASTRHYRVLAEIAGCWRRIFYAYSGNSLAVALSGMLGITAVFLLPLILWVFALAVGDISGLVGSVVGLLELVALRFMIARYEQQPLSTILWHPITWLGTLVFQAWSVTDGLRGVRPHWRGRTLPAEPVR